MKIVIYSQNPFTNVHASSVVCSKFAVKRSLTALSCTFHTNGYT